jgi:hypothetical protein
LLLARGFVGPTGRIAMIETEAGRGEAYSDPREYPELRGPDDDRNYDVISLRDNFAPSRYNDAIKVAERAGVQALIVDSGSHEWEAEGGVLDMAASNQAAGKKGQLVWQKPKIDHQKFFMLRLMQTPIPLVILCMRAKYPMEPDPNKKGDWRRSTKLEPKQSEDVLFEMMVHGWFEPTTHLFHPTKLTGRGLPEIFPDNQLITLETGKRFGDWASGRNLGTAPAAPTTGAGAAAPVPLTVDEIDAAHKVAYKGTKELNAWWATLRATPGAQLRHKDILDELKRMAADADANMIPGDDFPGAQ